MLVEAYDKTDKMLGVTCKSGSKIIGLSAIHDYKWCMVSGCVTCLYHFYVLVDTT